MGRSIGMYLIIFAMAPWVAHFYGNAELSALLRVTLLGTLFDGAMSPRSILLQKELKFGRWMTISNIGAICGVAPDSDPQFYSSRCVGPGHWLLQ